MTDLLGPGAFGAARAASSRPPASPGNGPFDPDTWVRDCSSPTANDGTENRAGLFNMLIAQLRQTIRRSRVTEDNTDDAMLARAVRSQGLNYVPAVGGTANALTATLLPAPTGNTELVGAPLRLLIATTNTGAVTLGVNGHPALPVLTMRGDALLRGDLPAGAIITLLSTGTSYRLASVAYSEFRRRLLTNLTIYINDVDGNDNNDGSANTAIGAFKSIQGAIDRIASIYDTGAYTITLKCAAGTYAAATFQTTRSLNLALVGEPADPSLVRISCPPGSAGVVAKEGCSISLDGFDLVGSGNGLDANNNGTIRYQNIHFSNTGTHVTANYASSATQTGPCVIKAATAVQHIFAGVTSSILTAFQTLSFSNPITFSVGFVVTGGGQAIVNGMTYSSVSNASGPRYFSNALGMIYVAGGGPTVLPGSTAGSTALGGVYG